MLYVWPTARAHEIDIEQLWSYAEFREVSLEAFVRDVVVPCAAEFDDEEAALRVLHESRHRRLLATAAVACAAAGIAAWRSR